MPLQQALSLHGAAELIHADIPYYVSVFNKILDALANAARWWKVADLGDILHRLAGLELLTARMMRWCAPNLCAASADFSKPRLGIGENKIHVLSGRFFQHLPTVAKILTGDITAFLKDLNCDLLPVSLKRQRRKLHQFGLHTLGQGGRAGAGAFTGAIRPGSDCGIRELANGRR